MEETLTWIIFAVPSFILAGAVHEYMHARVAYQLGDPTAAAEGRMTLNPLVHIDPFGFLMMILARFGWMKPVPVNEYNFQHPVRDMALTAAAGPFSNLIMAIITAIIYRALFYTGIMQSVGVDSAFYGFVDDFLITFLWVNIALMVFNLIPLPPLDGSRILRLFMPPQVRYSWDSFEKYSPFLLIIIFILPPISYITGALLSFAVSNIFLLLL